MSLSETLPLLVRARFFHIMEAEWLFHGWKKALHAITHTKGLTCSVTDNEILEAKALIDRSGIGCEPASAATVAGLRKLLSAHKIDKDETVLCILTGNLLKDTDIIREYHLGEFSNKKYGNPTTSIELSLESVSNIVL
jgi:threonine synthase